MASKPTAKQRRINFRASAREERLIRLGAEKRGMKITQFIIESACAEAEVALSDQTHFELPHTQFVRFTQALDRPAKVIPALQKLFAEESILERQPKTAPIGG
jgi:uncharacterized protein (DUF1778 family)